MSKIQKPYNKIKELIRKVQTGKTQNHVRKLRGEELRRIASEKPKTAPPQETSTTTEEQTQPKNQKQEKTQKKKIQ